MIRRLDWCPPRVIVALLALVLATGCTHLAEDVANHLAEHDVQVIERDFHVVEGDFKLFRKCLEKRGGTCQGSASTPLPHSSQDHDSKTIASIPPGGSTSLADSVAALGAGHPAKIAHGVLSHPVTQQAAALHDHLRGIGGGETSGISMKEGKGKDGQPESTVTMHVKLHQAEDFHGRFLSSLGTGAWDALDRHCRNLLATHGEAGVSQETEADCRRVAFIRGYFGAYLRHGEFVEVDVEATGLISRLEKEGFDSQFVEEIKDELAKADSALSNVFKISKIGFLSRDTTFSARLPTLEVILDPTVKHLVAITDADTGQVLTSRSDFRNLGVATDTSGVGTGASIGAEVVRVFLEAIFDAHEGLPAIAPANLSGTKPTGLTLGAYSLPLFKAPTGNIDSHDLTLMTSYNDAVALETRLIVGRIISGLGPFSLDNPPLESLITEIVATSVRKAVAKASWCWYACNLDVEVAKLVSDAGTALEDKLHEERQKLERDAERVKLRLELRN